MAAFLHSSFCVVLFLRLIGSFEPKGYGIAISGDEHEVSVTYCSVESLGLGSMVRGDFSTPLRSARNDSSARSVLL